MNNLDLLSMKKGGHLARTNSSVSSTFGFAPDATRRTTARPNAPELTGRRKDPSATRSRSARTRKSPPPSPRLFASRCTFACLAAFHLTAPTAQHLETTHVLMLNFDYDSSQPTPRTRFTLTEGKLVDIDLFLACSRGQKLGITQEELKAYFGPPPGPNVEEIEQVLYSVAVLAKDVKGSAGTASVVRYEVLHAERPKGSFSNSVVHKDWFDTIQRSPKGPAPKCYGEIFDRTLRERVAPAPFSFLQPGMTPEEEKIASQQNEWYSKMDIQAIMKAGRSLGEGGGVVTSFKETGELKTIGMNHRLGRFTDLTEIAKLKEERKAAKKSKEGAGSS